MDKHIATYFSSGLLFVLFMAACSQKPQSDVDTPQYHYRAGMRLVEKGEYTSALSSFQRSVDLDRKFALGYGGLGLTHALMGNLDDARANIGTAESQGRKDPDALALAARGWIALRDLDKRWFNHATDDLKRALKRDENHEAALYYYGEAYLYEFQFDEAEEYFSRVVAQKGDYAGKADEKWQLAQKVVRAAPGTDAGEKIALHEKITRADLAVLFIEELRVEDLFDNMAQTTPGFQTPAQMKAMQESVKPIDANGHWAAVWINDAVEYGLMEVFPDGLFYPDETITRASYALAVQRLLVAATRDNTLETRYFGESPSRFNDVPSTHPAYNAMALCTERGIMKADVISGRFNPNGNVSGADALLIIRTLQNKLRMTF